MDGGDRQNSDSSRFKLKIISEQEATKADGGGGFFFVLAMEVYINWTSLYPPYCFLKPLHMVTISQAKRANTRAATLAHY